MDKNKFEESLEQEIKRFEDVPSSIDNRIKNAFDQIDNMEKNKKSKFNFGKLTSLVASMTTLAFLAGNGVAFATGNPNIYSWVLNKIGIQKEYEEIKTEINQTSISKLIAYNSDFEEEEKDEVKITLMDLAYDDNFLIMGYKFDFDSILKTAEYSNAFGGDVFIGYKDNYKKLVDEIELKGYLDDNVYITKNNETINLNEKKYNFIKVNSDKELVIYVAHDISNYNLEKENNIKVSIDGISIDCIDASPTFCNGNWDFNIKDITKKNNIKNIITDKLFVEFNINDKYKHRIMQKDDYEKMNEDEKNAFLDPIIIQDGDKAKIEIDRIQTSEICTLFHTNINFDWSTVDHQMHWYAIDIIDNNGKIIMNKQIVKNDGNYITQKLNEGEEYMVRVWKYYGSYVNLFEEINNDEIEYQSSIKLVLEQNN